ncbi:unnamed protein product [Fraxinus pennsylvanica]|uniref:Chorismate-utilising enzyme C-terminal domain-containing protein n=1 Tax=Fraxinus pennsylvanica TaxID=56036 RepID=A0AAD1ZIS6_9LAMI|nr:unnamed protein product [Fraxinus pennsylvanica]
MLELMMLNDEKQCAEHIMLVDLGRNDVGKITSELLDDLTCWDTLQATLLVGTVKAMELIDRFEVTRRGPYSGGFGEISFMGDMKIALALRTMIFCTGAHYNTIYSYKDANKRQEWIAHIQAGAGIVADSDPHEEQIECQRKATGLVCAIELAESTFVNVHPAKIHNALC